MRAVVNRVGAVSLGFGAAAALVVAVLVVGPLVLDGLATLGRPYA